MKNEPTWLPKAAVLAIHERLLAEHGGAAGTLDEGSLDAALASPRNHFVYEHADIFRLAAVYAHTLTRNHSFRDGKQRVALTAAGVFLELNGFQLTASEQDAVTAILALSERTFDEDSFAAWVKASCTELSRPRTARSAKAGSHARRTRSPKP